MCLVTYFIPACIGYDEGEEVDEFYDSKGPGLGECEGDCDDDNDCQGELICFQREKGDPPPPGCDVRTESKTDFCYDPDGNPGGNDPDDDETWNWVCGESGNRSTSCSDGNDLKLIIKAEQSANEIVFRAKERKTDYVRFSVRGTRITRGPVWVNRDRSSTSSRCASLDCGSAAYVCVVAHDDPQRLSRPRRTERVAREIAGGNSVHAFVTSNASSGWNGGRVNNDGSTSGGNNDLSAAFCVR
jgi:hypothetical protein